ncbi:acetoacetate metabolism regulatory protein AtoC [Sulfuriferula plumbiphila]|uniref:Acetoacetate metabolism regulatory protein AtoC n=1 Tax=Sulfuriferula plumbiphila TaxID=171865 RepID=A0A512L7K3_9PROT|nr:sigma-54 dependent transcriptional regulator [Sulfuriferula plumbiphila]BBP04029.1 acetoacetate metabolism regulatory protein AtoC [Sulfuriferula plumbiphila]GEP30454.1 acetoacetate metabolism regulatory protein AtoC [Sulfuriferula plumbiphila]
MATILIVDDEFSIRKTLGLLLKTDQHLALEASNLAAAKACLDKHIVDLVITDMRIGEESGLDLLTYLKETGYAAESIMMTAYASIETAVEAMRLGAYDYLTKPINPDELLLRVRKVLEKKSLSEEVTRLRGELSGRGKFGHIAARSPRMVEIRQIVERIRDRDLPVLITGETGTGKEVLANVIHSVSARSHGPLVAINCCTLPEELLDSELFGHIKGSFTSATSNRKGLFQQAHGGTLFLDEIGDVSPRLQAKLLRALQEGEVRPVGSETPIKVNVRIIAATNCDLEEMANQGSFRRDLLFRLNVLPIHIPPLRERREDILPLIDHFLGLERKQLGRNDLNLSPAARQKLVEYDWPGNVRELKNVVERSFALHGGPVLEAHEISLSMKPNALDTAEKNKTLAQTEAEHIRRILAENHGNQVAAARVLGISRSTLRRKLEEMNLLSPAQF